MRTRTCCLLILLAASAPAQWSPQWRWLHPTPSGTDIRYLAVFSPTNWLGLNFVAGLQKTTDAGATWTVRGDVGSFSGPDAPVIYDGHFFDESNGWAVGQDGFVARTSDGGESWTVASTPIPNDIYVDGIDFLGDIGYLVGANGIAAKTTDGGSSWQSLATGMSMVLQEVQVIDTETVYAVGGACAFLKSTDGGASWDSVDLGSAYTLYDLHFTGPDTGVAVGSNGYFRFTFDGGATWDSSDIGSYPFFDVEYDEPCFYVAGPESLVYRTSDFGTHWETLNFWQGSGMVPIGMYRVEADGDLIVVAGGNGALYASDDGGETWRAISDIRNTGALQGIHVFDSRGRIWVAGEQDPTSLMLSTDGGEAWEPRGGGALDHDWACIRFRDDSLGLVVGSSGRITRTSDGGETWQEISSPAVALLYDVEFLDDTTFLACGNRGVVVKSTNAGLTWTLIQAGPTNVSATSLSSTSPDTCWLAMGGDILRTTTAGDTWETQRSTGGTLLTVDMVNSQVGYVCGWGSAIYKTTNGGANWSSVSNPMVNNITQIDFVDENVGWAAAGGGFFNFGAAIRTTSGGSSWQIVATGSWGIYGMQAINADSAFICGDGGGVLRYALPGSPVLEWNPEATGRDPSGTALPNPFTGRTSIRFGLPRAADVSLRVFDAAGREAAVLLDGVRLNPGTLTAQFDAAGLPRGVYQAVLVADGEVSARVKLVVVH